MIMDTQKKLQLIQYLETFLTDSRKSRFDEVIRHRMRHLTVVLENVYQSHNTSAVLRSADCLGIQDVHIIENNNNYQINPDVALGASKWLSIRRYNGEKNNTPSAYKWLKNNGYAVFATTPHTQSCTLEDLPVNRPLALVFGTEKQGLTDWAIENADGWVRIPMVGFTESFNISVSAALCMHYLADKIRKNIPGWEIPPKELLDIRLEWIRSSIDRCELLEERFFEKNAKSQLNLLK